MTMVERMARAIYDARNGPGATPFWRSGRSQKQAYTADALAALRELREPTDVMLDAAWQATDDPGYKPEDHYQIAISAAIDAAIAEHEGK